MIGAYGSEQRLKGTQVIHDGKWFRARVASRCPFGREPASDVHMKRLCGFKPRSSAHVDEQPVIWTAIAEHILCLSNGNWLFRFYLYD
jgi:hypothetical protein